MPHPPVDDSESAAALAAAAGGAEKRVYVRRIFSEIAPSYDLLNHLLSLNIDKRWRRKALRELAWERDRGGTYVDLCAGTLDVGAQLVKTEGFEGFVIGADFAEPMLRMGAGKAPRSVLSPVTADAQELPLPANSASGAIVAFGIRNLADLDAGLREVLRVLRPGARFVILEFTTPRFRLMRTLYHMYFHNILPFIGRIISGHKTAYRYLPESVKNFPEADALAARMTRAGFRDVTWKTLSFGIAAIHRGQK